MSEAISLELKILKLFWKDGFLAILLPV